jgi:tRNA threonylcarbamoyladenosine biosynthesis protein TsaB
MSGNWLILENSGRVARVGLARCGAVVRRAELDTARKHARELVPTIDGMLRAEALRACDLTGIVVGRGPGSYTGLRVGLSTVKALAYALGCEPRAIDTFAAIAEQAPAECESVWVIADALQEQVYAQRFDRTAAGWVACAELRILGIGEWLNELPNGAWVSGPGVNVYDARVPLDCPRVPDAGREARVESAFAVGMKVKPLSREELFALEPLYLRGSSAEEKAKRDAAKGERPA